MDLGDVAAYADWEELLTDPNIDLVDICLPPALHAAGGASRRPRPASMCWWKSRSRLQPADGRKMVQAAERAGKLLMIAHVLPFFPEYAYRAQADRERQIRQAAGREFQTHHLRPLAGSKISSTRTTVGGPLVDLHIHDAHFIRLVCGMPKALFSTGRMRGDVVELFNDAISVSTKDSALSAVGGVIRQQGRSFTHAFEIYLEHATLVYDLAVIDGQPVAKRCR